MERGVLPLSLYSFMTFASLLPWVNASFATFFLYLSLPRLLPTLFCYFPPPAPLFLPNPFPSFPRNAFPRFVCLCFLMMSLPLFVAFFRCSSESSGSSSYDGANQFRSVSIVSATVIGSGELMRLWVQEKDDTA